MGKAIEQGSGEPLASQDLGPFLEWQVGGDHQTGPFVSPADDLKEGSAPAFGHRDRHSDERAGRILRGVCERHEGSLEINR